MITLNFTQLQSLIDALTSLKEEKMPFKLSLIIAKDLSILNKEFEFYVEQERNFATKFLEFDESGNPVQSGDNMFKIKDGMQEECMKAREELNAFTCECELRYIPTALLEEMEFTPKQLEGLEIIIEEDEEV